MVLFSKDVFGLALDYQEAQGKTLTWVSHKDLKYMVYIHGYVGLVWTK